MKPRRDSDQRRSYAARRFSLAVDRLIMATQPADRDKARQWADLWGKLAKHRPERGH